MNYEFEQWILSKQKPVRLWLHKYCRLDLAILQSFVGKKGELHFLKKLILPAMVLLSGWGCQNCQKLV